MGPENYGKWELAQELEVIRQWTERWAVRWNACTFCGGAFLPYLWDKEDVCICICTTGGEGATVQNKNVCEASRTLLTWKIICRTYDPLLHSLGADKTLMLDC